jgi:type 1 fimbriae regulatory protein FimB
MFLLMYRHWLRVSEVEMLRRSDLFWSRSGGPVTRTQIFRLMRAYRAEAGIPPEKTHPHALRHSAGVHRAEAGLDVRLIQDRLGHRNIRNTVLYTRISSPLRDEAYSRALATGKVV